MPRRGYLKSRNNKARQLRARLSKLKNQYRGALGREDLIHAYRLQVQIRVISEFLEMI